MAPQTVAEAGLCACPRVPATPAPGGRHGGLTLHATLLWLLLVLTGLPAQTLRGYGPVTSDYHDHGAGSTLWLTCADGAKAAVLLAKFRRDLSALGGVTEGRLGAWPVFTVAGQGTVLAVRARTRVLLAAAPREAALRTLVGALGLDRERELDWHGGGVPAYLDKFDRWGFGCWFANPLRAPDRQEDTYDRRERFAWAKALGVGLQVDVQLNQSVGAGGQLDDGGKRWALELARDLGIPVSLQMQGAPPPQAYLNRYADQVQRKIPQFLGSWYGVGGNNGFPGSPLGQLSWAATSAKDALFADLYQAVRKYRSLPNLLSYGEWHGEVGEGGLALLMDHGPLVDQRFRDFLKARYQTPAAVDARWSGGAGLLKSWADVHFPEPAEFLGWGPRAVDLRGEWRVSLADQAPTDWGALDVADGGWRRLIAPGDDRQVQRQRWRVPTIFRRRFELTPAQLAGLGPRTWLYALTLEDAGGQSARAALNGQQLPAQPYRSHYPWAAFEVTGKLLAGANTLALCLPWGELNYRLYLSPDEPRCYPGLGPQRNAQWVDYRDCVTWLREDGLRRSLEAIRREDPDRFIKLYAPGAIPDVMKALAEDYGCYFHDTGGLAGNWSDDLPALMRSSGLPCSAEPGNGAPDLRTLKTFLGRWLTEGLQAVDYFSDLGELLWRPDQKAWCEAHQPLLRLLGKVHYPTAQVAVLAGARCHRLLGFPWDQFNTELHWWTRRYGVGTLGRLPNPRDLVTEHDFARGTVAKYKVIVDDATLIMDEALVSQIEAWVRAGGIFITQGQSGRHSPEVADAWPLARLTGYRAVGCNDNWRVAAVPGQPIFTDPLWTQVDSRNTPAVGGAGLLLEKVAPECRDILVWADRRHVAMGVRPLGRGQVITMGSPMPQVATGWYELLAWCGVRQPRPASAPGCRVARAVSNNGLFDVYTVWAENVREPGRVTLTVPGRQTALVDLLSGRALTGSVAGDEVTFADLPVEPGETYAFAAPRANFATAPLEWFRLQQQWWQGTRAPGPAPRPAPWPNTLPLDADWAFRPLATPAEATALVAPAVDDHAWTRRELGVWYGTQFPDTLAGVFRRRFTTPPLWRDGRTWLWVRGSSQVTFLPPYKTRLYLDGELVSDAQGWRYASCCVDVTDRLTPGEHTLAVASEHANPVGGVPANLWLEHIPAPAARQPLDGNWGAVKLPGRAPLPFDQVRREVTVDPAQAGRRVVLYVETTENHIIGLYLDGRRIMRDFGGQHCLFDLTPHLRPGQPSVLSLLAQYPGNPAQVKTVELRYYEPGSY